MKEFVTAVEAAENDDEEGWVDFKVDGYQCRARRPSPGQVAYLSSTMHKHAPLHQKIAGSINFCFAVMDEDSASYLSEKLLSQSDAFELPQVQDIIEFLLEEWSGRPTERSSDSSSTAATTGSNSTPSGPTLISSDSGSTGS